MADQSYDVVIIGAGPAGTAAAIALRESKLSVALVDRASFPRDKTCGDALSVDVVRQLEKLSPALYEAFHDMPRKTRSGGVRIVAPGGETIDLPFVAERGTDTGFVCRRKDFDMLMASEAKRCENVTFIESCNVNDVNIVDEHAFIETSQGNFTAKVIIAADGAQSVVKRKLTSSKIDANYHSAGLRSYHSGVNGFSKDNYIELHFLPNVLPGYLWVFPLPDGDANVGIGMLTSAVSSGKVNLVRTLRQSLSSHSLLHERFSKAVALESPAGHGLPLGGRTRALSGRRYLLTGDAASLIDPFSGEGIGNAIRSGRFAALQVIDSFIRNDFSVEALRQYDKKMYQMLRSEFKVSRTMLRLSQHPWILNTIVKKANKNDHLRQTLINALAHPDKKRWLVNPMFYFNLFFRS